MSLFYTAWDVLSRCWLLAGSTTAFVLRGQWKSTLNANSKFEKAGKNKLTNQIATV